MAYQVTSMAVDRDLWKELRKIAIDKDMLLKDLMTQIVQDYLEKRQS